MDYSTQLLATPTPVDIIEGKEGLSKITTFEELIPFTMRALLTGYGCTADMMDRIENESSIYHLEISPIHFFTTSNPHTFAACTTNTNISLKFPSKKILLEQHEVLDLVPSLSGSFKSPGSYYRITNMDGNKNTLSSRTLQYAPPVFDIALRYIVLFKSTYKHDDFLQELYRLVLYIPAITYTEAPAKKVGK